ncbi:hypothetical protein AF332_11870 [Sporosarcina globispora]|uniref:Uncharacterized protein n=1 Tax=Sporosarcina globispora TaxID=1459 RepID=A0A0M0GDG4_SPOGL|nr:hypothetical protein [Sporosarcina globispora]KON87456.1 hypothetical protein AF332_11870 [Sporosarcina globispora]
MKILGLTKEAYREYKGTTRDNHKTSYDQARRKLTRNVKLGEKQKSLFNWLKGQQEYIYGQLKIVVKEDTIIEVENDKKHEIKDWVKDEEEYNHLSKKLNIKDYKKKRHNKVS